jgi:hypothetical protein
LPTVKGGYHKGGLNAGNRITFCLAALISIVGLPYCFFVFLGAHRPDIPSVTEETMRHVLPIPWTIIVLSVVSLIFGRHLVGKNEPRVRGWALAMILLSLLMVLLLYTESPY